MVLIKFYRDLKTFRFGDAVFSREQNVYYKRCVLFVNGVGAEMKGTRPIRGIQFVWPPPSRMTPPLFREIWDPKYGMTGNDVFGKCTPAAGGKFWGFEV